MQRTSPFWNKAVVERAVESAPSVKEALDRLGYASTPNNYVRLRTACERYSLPYPRAGGTHARPTSARASKIRDREALAAALRDNATARGVLVQLGVAPAGKNYDLLIVACHDFNLVPPARRANGRRRAPEDRFPDRDALLAAMADGATMAEALRALGRHSTDTGWLRAAAAHHQVEVADGRARNKGRRRLPLDLILVENSTYSNNQNLKRYLVAEGLLDDECALCGQGPEWLGLPLILQLDHINGNRRDNRIENLRVLCPNCHSQTDTFTGRNRTAA